MKGANFVLRVLILQGNKRLVDEARAWEAMRTV